MILYYFIEQWEKYQPDMNTETNINEPHCEDDDFNVINMY